MVTQVPAYSRFSYVGLEGVLLTLFPTPFLLVSWGPANWGWAWPWILAGVASGSGLGAGLALYRFITWGKFFSSLGLCALAALTSSHWITDPFAAFLGAIGFIFIGFSLFQFKPHLNPEKTSDSQVRADQRLLWGLISLLTLSTWILLFTPIEEILTRAVLLTTFGLVLVLGARWAWLLRKKKILLILAAVLVLGGVLAWLSAASLLVLSATGSALLWRILLKSQTFSSRVQLWRPKAMVNPAQILPITFFLLCLIGSFLLALPGASTQGISILDAAFTSVSAVCVTGLIVLDTPKDFTGLGLGIILILIQLGGLGIMSLTTLALHAIGQRLSLKQERLMVAVTQTDRSDLITSLVFIIKFTLVCELSGAVLLTLLIHGEGQGWGAALWQGLFTAVSAFCNAGFALWSDSLIPYQQNIFILQTVSFLIILGGLAPATCLMAPRWIKGEPIPLAFRIPLVTTAVLLGSGTLLLLMFEWNGFLSGLSWVDKLSNAWFQSVTLRTAGFNSVDLAQISGPTYLIMLLFMIIGGSPGGTAGGVKTATFGVLALIFWATVTGKSKVIVQNRRIPPELVYRAIAILVGYGVVGLSLLMMLEVTQPQIPAWELVFETVSAIGTVGLSVGATSQLDEVGKIIVMFAMFAGRIGPVTLFMMLHIEPSRSMSQYTDAKIALT